MPNIQSIRAGIAELPKGPPLVVVITGATSGIGSYTVKAYADTFAKSDSKLRVYIVGRTAANAEELLSYGRKTSPGSDWRFVQASNLALISDVDRVSKEIIKQEEEAPFAGDTARVDVLYMGHALSPFQESKPTEEGIDAQMSCLYYSRMRFIQNLTPLLLAASTTAHVISIFAGTMEETIKPGELPIGVPPPAVYGMSSVRGHTAFMKTFAFEELAEKHAGKISFNHIYPGLVDGPTFYRDVNPRWVRIIWQIMKPLAMLYMTSPAMCGEVMVFLATQRYPAKGSIAPGSEVAASSQQELGGGAYSVGQRGDEKKAVSYAKVRKADTGKKVWEHTMEMLKQAESRGSV